MLKFFSPLIFGILAQACGLGGVAPLYFILHYVNSPLNRLITPNQRIEPKFSRAIFLTLTVFCYLPIFLMFLAPLTSTRHFWTWVWQMFPLWVSVAQWVRTRTSKVEASSNQKEGKNSNNEDHIIRATISAFAAVSAGVWIYMLLNSPYSLNTIFLPQRNPENTFVSITRTYFQISHLVTLGSALLWLVYLFADLKNADLVEQSWIFLLAIGGAITLCSGPGVTLAAGWYWREHILLRECQRAYAEGTGEANETGRYKKIALHSLDELCFGGVRRNIKVL